METLFFVKFAHNVVYAKKITIGAKCNNSEKNKLILTDSYNSYELLTDSYNSYELLTDSYNSCELLTDSYNCCELLTGSYNCYKLLTDSYNSLDVPHLGQSYTLCTYKIH